MSVAVIVPPATWPVSLDDVHRQIRMDVGDDDPYLVGLIQAATLLAEQWLQRSLITQTLEMRADAFISTPLRLARPPIAAPPAAVVVKYDDTLGAEVTLDPDSYRLISRPDASLVTVYGSTWPVAATGSETVRITYEAGYGAAEDVPMPIRQAILLLVGHWYAHRETIVLGETPAELPIAAQTLISAYRIPVTP